MRLDAPDRRPLWEALEARDLGPRGREHDFRARCPHHDGDNDQALHVWEVADAAAMVHCFRGCGTRDVVRALGLNMRDLFPPGHDRARPIRGVGKPVPFADRVLHQLRKLGVPYRATPDPGFWVALCPACTSKSALWIFETTAGGSRSPAPEDASRSRCSER
jgi:hypothetical protein